MKAKNTIGKIYVSQCLFRTFCKLQSICLIGGRVFNPRQQHIAYSRLVTISRCSKPAAAAGYKPAPQLGRQIASFLNIYPYVFKTFDLSFMFHFYVSTYWISIIQKNETYDFNVSFLVSCFIFQNTKGALSRSLSVFRMKH